MVPVKHRDLLYVRGETGSAVVGLDPVFLYVTMSWYLIMTERGRCGGENECLEACRSNRNLMEQTLLAKVNALSDLHLVWQLRCSSFDRRNSRLSEKIPVESEIAGPAGIFKGKNLPESLVRYRFWAGHRVK